LGQTQYVFGKNKGLVRSINSGEVHFGNFSSTLFGLMPLSFHRFFSHIYHCPLTHVTLDQMLEEVKFQATEPA
jgi:hypothetical protein